MHYTLEKLERHWKRNHNDFNYAFRDWIDAYRLLIPLAGDVLRSLSGKKALAENCAYLLFAKGFNHALAAYSLMPRGLLIDASLSARNAIETFLMLELFATDPTEDYFNRWSQGEEFKPSWVRNQLGDKLSATVRDVIIEAEGDYYETVKLAYSFWSGITHANLRSSDYSSVKTGPNSFDIQIGGHLDNQEAFINSIFAVVGTGLHRCALITAGVFSTHLFDTLGSKFDEAQNKIDSAMANRHCDDKWLVKKIGEAIKRR
jgi:hypothetical protein